MELVTQYLKSIILHPEFHRYFSYGFFALVIYTMRGYFWVNKAQLIKDMKGEDGRWDAVEVAFFAWLILFSTAILGSLFFGLTMPHEAWWSLDTMGVFVLAGKRGPDIILAMKAGKSTTQMTQTIETSSGSSKTEVKSEKKGGGGTSESLDNIGHEE